MAPYGGKKTDMVGERLRALRQARGMTQVDLSRASMVTQQTISSLESGRVQDPEMATVVKLAVGLGVPVEDLTGQATPRNPLSETERQALLDQLNRLPPDEQQTILGLVRRLAAMPPETARPQGDAQ